VEKLGDDPAVMSGIQKTDCCGSQKKEVIGCTEKPRSYDFIQDVEKKRGRDAHQPNMYEIVRIVSLSLSKLSNDFKKEQANGSSNSKSSQKI